MSQSVVLRELDRVKLRRLVTAKGQMLRAGLAGTIVYCHGTEAFEVEFPGVQGFFLIEADDVAPLQE